MNRTKCAELAQLARNGGPEVGGGGSDRTRARMTQVMNLFGLAPDIQEKILCWPAVTSGKDPISERGIRAVVAELEWGESDIYSIRDFDRCHTRPLLA
ncbi:MAG: hypothetical protein JWM11_5430 [Planctomycetaceae bacterium]|nr:hypothetical protein [Planctomycetaceae bacterium]